MSTDEYDFHYMCLDWNLSDQQLKEILDFFESLPIYKELDINISENRKKHFIIVHGGIKYGCLTQAETVRNRILIDTPEFGWILEQLIVDEHVEIDW